MVLRNFIVFEGIDGAGTTTQTTLLKNNPATEKFLFTAEPTNSEIGLFLRRMLKGDVKVSNETAAYLFAADRNEHVNGPLVVDGDRHLVTGLAKAQEQGYVTVSDRYLFSSLAYQSINCDPKIPEALNQFFPLPRLLIFLDIEPSEALKRMSGRSSREIYEKEDFLIKTTASYRRIMDEFSKPEKKGEMEIMLMDATRPPEEIHKAVWQKIQEIILNS
ncbi:MAG: dTMP kinase [Treponema sp.]|nr:dTMP kinase [Treponema sp.]MBP5753165.1 dTMP kinase [Treponema sp.]